MLPLFVGPGVYGDPVADADGELRVKFSMTWRFPRADDFPDMPHACSRSTGASIRETITTLLKLQVSRCQRERPPRLLARLFASSIRDHRSPSALPLWPPLRYFFCHSKGIPVDSSNPLMAVPPVMSFLGEFDTVVHPGQLISDGIKRCRHGGRLLCVGSSLLAGPSAFFSFYRFGALTRRCCLPVLHSRPQREAWHLL